MPTNPTELAPIHFAAFFVLAAIVLAAIEAFIQIGSLAFGYADDEGNATVNAQCEPNLPPPFNAADEAEFRRRAAAYENEHNGVRTGYNPMYDEYTMPILAANRHLN